MVHKGQHTLIDWTASCATKGGDHSLLYSDDCPGNDIVRNRHYLEMYKNQCTATFHLHYKRIRGLNFNPRVSTINAMECQSIMCTVSTALSSWPSPCFNNGVAWGTMTVDVYTCSSTDYNDLRLSGNFRGTIYMAWWITYAGAGGCVATSADGIIKISYPVLSWCDIWIDSFAGVTTVNKSATALRSVCKHGTAVWLHRQMHNPARKQKQIQVLFVLLTTNKGPFSWQGIIGHPLIHRV